MIDPCSDILDLEDFIFAAPDAEWTGKPGDHEPIAPLMFEPGPLMFPEAVSMLPELDANRECLYWADMPINHFPEAGKKEER
mgnify:CR=1 FL=1